MHQLRNGMSLALATWLSVTPVLACTEDGVEGILPENDLSIPADPEEKTVARDQFDAIIAKIAGIYAPIVAQHGGQLKILKNWADGTVNARANRSGALWQLLLYGGMARHPRMTNDAYALVICHELGHHLGGAPKKKPTPTTRSWASNEGQADYYGTLKCMRKVFLHDDNAAILKTMTVYKPIVDYCKRAWKTPADFYICVRSGLAGNALASVFQDISKERVYPKLETPTRNAVATTNDGHPASQCRLDTYVQGAMCRVDDRTDVSDTNERVGVCHPANGDKFGGRPFCWYHP